MAIQLCRRIYATIRLCTLTAKPLVSTVTASVLCHTHCYIDRKPIPKTYRGRFSERVTTTPRSLRYSNTHVSAVQFKARLNSALVNVRCNSSQTPTQPRSRNVASSPKTQPIFRPVLPRILFLTSLSSSTSFELLSASLSLSFPLSIWMILSPSRFHLGRASSLSALNELSSIVVSGIQGDSPRPGKAPQSTIVFTTPTELNKPLRERLRGDPPLQLRGPQPRRKDPLFPERVGNRFGGDGDGGCREGARVAA